MILLAELAAAVQAILSSIRGKYIISRVVSFGLFG
jgi:hypothetical protein